jgi:oligoendopeptidase F
LRLRQLLASASFERTAYDNPDADLDRLLAELEARYLLVRPHAEHTRWAADSFYSIYPVYLHNYVFADLVASQVHATLRRELTEPYGNRDTFSWLAERLYRPGVAQHWRTQVIDATGSDLDAQFLAADLAALDKQSVN